MLSNWWLERRNRLLASRRFQRAAGRLWPLRPVTRRYARRLFDLVAGFTYSQTLVACVRLGLIDLLAKGPRTPGDLARLCDMPSSSIDRLVRAAEALDLVQRRADGRVTLGVLGAALAGNPGVAAMVTHHDHLYADLADPVALLRSGGHGALAGFWDYARGDDPAAVAAYSTLMAASNDAVAEQVLDAYAVDRHRRLLDVGGGEGRFLELARLRAPTLKLGLFDLPAVVVRGRKRLGDGAEFHAGDAVLGQLPTGYDCISLIRVLHDHDDARAIALLRNIRAAMPAGGVLLVGEPMNVTKGADPVGSTYFGWYLLAMGQGRARPPAEIGRLLCQAGFTSWRQLRTALPLVTSLLVVNKD